jgi:hypothetical protein
MNRLRRDSSATCSSAPRRIVSRFLQAFGSLLRAVEQSKWLSGGSSSWGNRASAKLPTRASYTAGLVKSAVLLPVNTVS